MGNQLSTGTAQAAAQLDYYLHEFPGVVYESSLGKGRFLKTMQCIHDEGTVVVKVYVKRDATQSIRDQAEKLNGTKSDYQNSHNQKKFANTFH
jgi:phosphoinositide-3-kinase regulatory subunit 4